MVIGRVLSASLKWVEIGSNQRHGSLSTALDFSFQCLYCPWARISGSVWKETLLVVGISIFSKLSDGCNLSERDHKINQFIKPLNIRAHVWTLKDESQREEIIVAAIHLPQQISYHVKMVWPWIINCIPYNRESWIVIYCGRYWGKNFQPFSAWVENTKAEEKDLSRGRNDPAVEYMHETSDMGVFLV